MLAFESRVSPISLFTRLEGGGIRNVGRHVLTRVLCNLFYPGTDIVNVTGIGAGRDARRGKEYETTVEKDCDNESVVKPQVYHRLSWMTMFTRSVATKVNEFMKTSTRPCSIILVSGRFFSGGQSPFFEFSTHRIRPLKLCTELQE